MFPCRVRELRQPTESVCQSHLCPLTLCNTVQIHMDNLVLLLFLFVSSVNAAATKQTCSSVCSVHLSLFVSCDQVIKSSSSRCDFFFFFFFCQLHSKSCRLPGPTRRNLPGAPAGGSAHLLKGSKSRYLTFKLQPRPLVDLAAD